MKIQLKQVFLLLIIAAVLVSPAILVREANRSKRNEQKARERECLQDLAERLEAGKLVGTPAAQIAACLPFAASRRDLEDGSASYKFQHPTKRNGEGPADIWIIVDPATQTIVRAELLYYDW